MNNDYSNPMPIENGRRQSVQTYPEQSAQLRLQPWCESHHEDRTVGRFGGYARQIEADVLRAIHRAGG